MTHPAFCPHCNSVQPHRVGSEELGGVEWCQTCQAVHPAVKDAHDCGGCHYWRLEQCVQVFMMMGRARGKDCPHYRARRAIPEPQIEF